MARPPASDAPSTSAKIRAAQGGLERALDPLAKAVKRAVQPVADLAGHLTPGGDAPAPGKPGLDVSPLAVPMPVMPPLPSSR